MRRPNCFEVFIVPGYLPDSRDSGQDMMDSKEAPCPVKQLNIKQRNMKLQKCKV